MNEFSLKKSKEIYLDNYILDLIEKDNIIPFYNNNELDDFILSIKYFYYNKINDEIKQNKEDNDVNRLKNDKEELFYYKLIIYSLSNFNETNMYIILNNFKLIEKFKLDIKTPLELYIVYLKVIKKIYYYMVNKNNNHYYINFYEEYNISEKIEKKLEIMKKNININKIISEIIKTYENIGINKNFDFIKNWFNNYINQNSQMIKEYKKISKEKNNILSYFKYLYINCNIIIRIIEIFNEINEILKYSNVSDKYLDINIEFQNSNDKISSKKNSEDSLFEMINGIIYQNYMNKNKKYIGKLRVYFYYDEEKEKFYEICSKCDLKEFIKNKCSLITKFLTEFFDKYLSKIQIKDNKQLKEDNNSLSINNEFNSKLIYIIVEETIFDYYIKTEETKNEIISNYFGSLFKDKTNSLPFYIKNTFDDINKPKCEDFLFFINQKINKIIFNILEPSLSLNHKIYILINGGLYLDYLNLNNYNNCINIDEIIAAIIRTKYHENINLNSLFQIKAINYLIKNNSNFSLFIYDLFESLYNKVKKRKLDINLEDYKFKIKFENGKKYTQDDFFLFKRNIKENQEDIEEEYKPNKKQLKHNKKIEYKLFKYDTDVEYNSNYFQFKSNYLYYYYLNTNEIIPKKFNNIDKTKEINFPKINDFINVYDLIFTVKNIDKNNIINIEQNDISEILKPYSEKEKFNSLLKQNFSCKIDEEEEEKNDDIIKNYLKSKFN